MTSTRTMTSASGVLPFRRGTTRPRPGADPQFLLAVELFIVVVLDAIFVVAAMSHIAELASLYATVT
jgi:hypothetical protein